MGFQIIYAIHIRDEHKRYFDQHNLWKFFKDKSNIPTYLEYKVPDLKNRPDITSEMEEKARPIIVDNKYYGDISILLEDSYALTDEVSIPYHKLLDYCFEIPMIADEDIVFRTIESACDYSNDHLLSRKTPNGSIAAIKVCKLI